MRTQSQDFIVNPLLDYKNNETIVRSDYEKMWDMLRTTPQGITIKDVVIKHTSITYDKAKAWLKALEIAGYVDQTDKTAYNNVCTKVRYKLVRDIGQQPPKITAKGSVKPDSAADVIWRTARILKTFNANQIVASGSTPELTLKLSNVKQYLRQLYLAGYLQIRQSGKAKVLAIYQMRHDTGPKAPKIKRGKRVYDANLGLIVYDPETPLPPSHIDRKESAHV